MRWIKLAVFVVLAAALVGASVLFKDRLAERGLEAALEGVFRARADVEGLRFAPLRGRLAFRSLAVADEREPMANLFQLGPTEVELNLVQLLSRKVVVESVACTDIRWGTPRAASGALPAAGGPSAAPAAPGGGPALPSLGQLGFDPAALLAAEEAKLKSPAAYEQASASAKATSEQWQTRTADLGKKGDRLAEGTAALQKVDFRNVKSLDEARKSYEAVEAVAPVLADAQKELKTASTDFQTDLAKARSTVAGANAQLEEDVRYVRSQVALPEGGLKGAISGLGRRAVEQRLGRFSSLAFRALEAAGRMRENRTDAKKKPPARRAGRDVPFPTTARPSFVLKSFAFSVKPEGASLSGELKDLSSNPELWGRPATFRADWSSGGRSAQLSGEIDTRESGPRARIEARGAGFDFALSDLLWVGTAAGVYAFRTTADVAGSAVAGKAAVTTGAVRTGEAKDMAGRVVKDAIEGAKEITLDIDYKATGGDFSVALRSNLDDEIGRQLSARLADLKADYQKQAEAELRKSIAPELARAQEQIGGLDKSRAQIAALDGRTEGFRKEIDAKKAEYAAAVTRLGGAGRLRLPGF